MALISSPALPFLPHALPVSNPGNGRNPVATGGNARRFEDCGPGKYHKALGAAAATG